MIFFSGKSLRSFYAYCATIEILNRVATRSKKKIVMQFHHKNPCRNELLPNEKSLWEIIFCSKSNWIQSWMMVVDERAQRVHEYFLSELGEWSAEIFNIRWLAIIIHSLSRRSDSIISAQNALINWAFLQVQKWEFSECPSSSWIMRKFLVEFPSVVLRCSEERTQNNLKEARRTTENYVLLSLYLPAAFTS